MQFAAFEPPAQRLEHVLANASKVHPQMRSELESSFGVWWKKVKYSEGGYATGADFSVNGGLHMG